MRLARLVVGPGRLGFVPCGEGADEGEQPPAQPDPPQQHQAGLPVEPGFLVGRGRSSPARRVLSVVGGGQRGRVGQECIPRVLPQPIEPVAVITAERTGPVPLAVASAGPLTPVLALDLAPASVLALVVALVVVVSVAVRVGFVPEAPAALTW